jgi:sec-independent protein translocase protein TatA
VGTMIGNLMGGDGLIVLIVALVVLVGGSQLPKIARNVGLAGKEFRKAQSEADEQQAAKAKADGGAHAGPQGPAPAALPSTPPAPGAATSPPAADGSISLTPAQLDALLKAREDQVRNESTGN